MLRLPELVAGSNRWRLPLPDNEALWLLAAVVAPQRAARLRLLSQLLAHSPALLTWAVCHPQSRQACRPQSIADVAGQFLDRAIGLLHWGEAEQPEPSCGEDKLAQWARLSSRCLDVARRAAQMAGGPSPAGSPSQTRAENAYLLGMLHAAADWLSSCGPDVGVSPESPQDSPLPSWLAAAIRAAQRAAEPAPDSASGLGLSDGAQFTAADAGSGAGDGDCPVSEPEIYLLVGEALRQHRQQSEQSGCAPSTPDQEPEPTDRSRQSQPEIEAALAAVVPHLLAKLRRLEKLESEFEQTLQQEKLESLRQFAYGASHEINNPLANISTRAQTLLRDEPDPERRKRLATINTQAFRAHEMISDLMLFVRPPALRPTEFDLGALIRQVVTELEPLAVDQGTRLEYAPPLAPLMITADRLQLAVALKSLCVNSLEALPADGIVEVSVRREPPTRPDNSAIAIAVRDTGSGISPAARRHLFDPFYSGREAGRGLGLGLSKCWRIVTLHGGRIDVESEPGHGATFTIRLPAVPAV